jgi:hypothetical protein
MSIKETQSQLEGIINICKSIADGTIDPFTIDIEYVLNVIRRFYPEVKSVKDLCLDATAIKELSSVIEKQNEWIQLQSSILYKDPFMLNQQILTIDVRAIAEALLRSWHPIVDLEQITPRTIFNSIRYWSDLLPIDERWADTYFDEVEAGIVSKNEAKEMGILTEEMFSDLLEDFWIELKLAASKNKGIKYWDWIAVDTYDETVKRAYLTSYLVGYGYASIEIDKFGEEIILKPFEEQRISLIENKISIPILVDYDEWKKNVK